MAPDQSPDELLAHFNRPKTLALHEASWVDDIKPSPQQKLAGAADDQLPTASSNAKRKACCVLKWAMAVGVLVVSASQLIEFAYLSVAEHSLNLAARAAAFEATLPRASYESIAAAVDRKLVSYPRLGDKIQLTVLQNGHPITRQVRPGESDRISVTLSAPSSVFTPSWLIKLPRASDDTHLTAHAERTTPSHKLRPEHSQTAAE